MAGDVSSPPSNGLDPRQREELDKLSGVSADRSLPTSVRVVVVGGGIAGASIAYHLTELGERDVLLVDRAELTSGSTFHSAGLVGQLRADPTLTRMNMYSVELYRRLQRTDHAPSWVECGGLRLASSPERLAEIRRQIGWARAVGLPIEEVSAAQAQELFPLLSPEGVLGAAYLPTDGYVDPSQLCYALAKLARDGGAVICPHTRVWAIDTARGRVTGVHTDRGPVECEVVVNCGGMFAAEIGRMVDVRVPVVPMSHQYLVTEGFFERGDRPLPTLRDPDLLVYYRQELDGLVMGGYERHCAPWTASAQRYDAVPVDFNGRLLPEDWDRFLEITENSQIRVPTLADVGVRKLINGPEAFTPDNEFCLGETEVGGFFVAAGLCAHGIAGAGGIGKVVAEWIVDIRYPSHERRAGRPLRTSPIYSWHAEHGAFFGEKGGWERVNYYQVNAVRGDESLRPDGWAGRHWSPAICAEHLGTRASAGLIDETSFSKIEVTGSDAARFLEWVCDNVVARGPGSVTYTQALNSLGGIESDFTVTQLEDQAFRIITGTASGNRDLGWLRKQARIADVDVRITDITGQFACIGLWGPRAREVLGALTPADLSNAAFPFMSTREITVGDVPVRALRMTFVGELGWELYCSTEYGAALWRTLWEAGQPHGLIAAGYRAIDSMRLEKGYRVWGADIGSETTPYEAGLGLCVKLDKPGGFLGRDALLAARERGVRRRLRAVSLDDPRRLALGNEPVRVGDTIVGHVTSGGYGYTLGRSIAYASLPVPDVAVGTEVSVEIFGRRVSGIVTVDPLFDPNSTRVRADAG